MSITNSQPAGVYSNADIVRFRDSGEIVIEPFDTTQVAGASYDVRLGEYYIPIRQDAKFLNPYNPGAIGEYFLPPAQAQSLEDFWQCYPDLDTTGLGQDDSVIYFEPMARILAHTVEFIGIRGRSGTSQMQARSTMGRLGFSVCFCAGWGDPGYINRWTMEICNLNPVPSILAVNTRIAQIVFMSTGPVDGEYSRLTGNYQANSAHELSIIVDNWHPEMMMPKSLSSEI